MALETSTVVCCVSGQLEPLKVKHAILLIALSSAVALALCRTMVTMTTQMPHVVAPLRNEIVSHFNKVVVVANNSSQESKDLVVGMATLIFQSYQGVSQEDERKLKLDNMILEQLERLVTSSR
ncbi:unnamed protein product [Porites lobata]|uniref:Uncharacterized protein n=1 Tax=Porites lobata TaxID=104759 RepID=A0ABN8NVK1_9CNID|nr:unnamed protein product [Porites lobata]